MVSSVAINAEEEHPVLMLTEARGVFWDLARALSSRAPAIVGVHFPYSRSILRKQKQKATTKKNKPEAKCKPGKPQHSGNPLYGWIWLLKEMETKQQARAHQQLAGKLLQIVRGSRQRKIGNEKVRNDSLKKTNYSKDRIL